MIRNGVDKGEILFLTNDGGKLLMEEDLFSSSGKSIANL